MPMETPRTLVVPCEVGPDADGASGEPGLTPCCHKCHTTLDLCQPSFDQPDELLGLCQDCGAWHYVAYLPERSEILVAHLPLKTLVGPASVDRKVTPRRPRLQRA